MGKLYRWFTQISWLRQSIDSTEITYPGRKCRDGMKNENKNEKWQ